MSDRPCNYCLIKDIRRRWKGKGKIILKRSNFMAGWTDVYHVPTGQTLDTRIDPKTGNHLASGQFAMSCMEIPESCAC